MRRVDWIVRARTNGSFIVRELPSGRQIAILERTPWGKWKIVGEDTYAPVPTLLLSRLIMREIAPRDARVFPTVRQRIGAVTNPWDGAWSL